MLCRLSSPEEIGCLGTEGNNPRAGGFQVEGGRSGDEVQEVLPLALKTVVKILSLLPTSRVTTNKPSDIGDLLLSTYAICERKTMIQNSRVAVRIRANVHKTSGGEQAFMQVKAILIHVHHLY